MDKKYMKNIWMDRKKDGWLDEQKKYMKKIWMVGWIKKMEKKLMDGGWIERRKKQMDGRMDRKNI